MPITRRRFIRALSALASIVPFLPRSAAASLASRADNLSGVTQEMTLWYREAAEQWIEALPVGNGRLGAMIFGGIALERISLNEDTLWSGAPRD